MLCFFSHVISSQYFQLDFPPVLLAPGPCIAAVNFGSIGTTRRAGVVLQDLQQKCKVRDRALNTQARDCQVRSL